MATISKSSHKGDNLLIESHFENIVLEVNVNDLISSAVRTNNISELRVLITDKNYQHDHLMLNSLYCEKIKSYNYLLGVKSRTLKSYENKFPLHKAISEADTEQIETLLNENKKLIDNFDNFNRTPLYNAVEGGNINVVKTILKYDNSPNTMVGTDNSLLLAVIRGDTAIVKCLMSIKVIELNVTNTWQQTPIILSVLYNRLDIFKLLHSCKSVNRTCRDKFELTYQDYIMEKNREDMYPFLSLSI